MKPVALRVRFPNAANKEVLEAVIVNTAGGMAGGDRFDIDMTVGRRRAADRDHGRRGKGLSLAGTGYAGRA